MGGGEAIVKDNEEGKEGKTTIRYQGRVPYNSLHHTGVHIFLKCRTTISVKLQQVQDFI